MMIDPVSTTNIRRLLDDYRARYGISSDEKLARALGVSKQAIYRWRRGEIDRSARVLLAIAHDLRNDAPVEIAA